MKLGRTSHLILILCMGMAVLTLTACGSSGPADRESKGVFYEVHGGENDVFLFGSVHVGNEDMYPLHKKVTEAFEAADVLGLEIDLSSKTDMEVGQKMATWGRFHDGRQMTDLISEGTFNEVTDMAATAGVDEATLNQFQPWYATLLLSELAIAESDFSPQAGIETYFLEQVEEGQDMDIISLETIEDQFVPYQQLSDDSQARYLEMTLDELDRFNEDLHDLVDHWQASDTDTLANFRETQIEEAETESLKEYQLAMWDERDRQMTDKIETLLESDSGDTYFIVVGAMHLVGENSIVDGLTDRGYDLQAVYE